MTEVKREYLIKNYIEAIESKSAALFVGAGMSVAKGFVDWPTLLKDIADELDLSVDKETDLIAVAQFHVNRFSGNRTKLDELLIKEFTKKAKSSVNHDLFASLPIDTVWTTNYDTLIEDAYARYGKIVAKKSTIAHLAQTQPGADAVVYKMHGDVSSPDEAILTKDDYETYADKRGLFSVKLQGDLVSKTFLFLGFSFSDPNIEYILSRVRTLIGKRNERHHYYITKHIDPPKNLSGKKKAEWEYAKRRQSLVISDLARFGIQAVMIDKYEEITDILKELKSKVNRKSIFVSGSSSDFNPLGRNRLEALSSEIGEELIRQGWNLVSGYGLGIGGVVALGAMGEVYRSDGIYHSAERTVLRPFPQNPIEGMTLEQTWTTYRQDLISQAGVILILSGNKIDPTTGKTKIADGVMEEWRIAKKMGMLPIPIGATGHAAEVIWKEVKSDFENYFPATSKTDFEAINNPKKTNKQIIKSAMNLIKSYIK